MRTPETFVIIWSISRSITFEGVLTSLRSTVITASLARIRRELPHARLAKFDRRIVVTLDKRVHCNQRFHHPQRPIAESTSIFKPQSSRSFLLILFLVAPDFTPPPMFLESRYLPVFRPSAVHFLGLADTVDHQLGVFVTGVVPKSHTDTKYVRRPSFGSSRSEPHKLWLPGEELLDDIQSASVQNWLCTVHSSRVTRALQRRGNYFLQSFRMRGIITIMAWSSGIGRLCLCKRKICTFMQTALRSKKRICVAVQQNQKVP